MKTFNNPISFSKQASSQRMLVYLNKDLIYLFIL